MNWGDQPDHSRRLKLDLNVRLILNNKGMRQLIAIAGLIVLITLFLSCQTKDPDKIGAAGKAEEMADSTRLDSSVTARNSAGGEPSKMKDTM